MSKTPQGWWYEPITRTAGALASNPARAYLFGWIASVSKRLICEVTMKQSKKYIEIIDLVRSKIDCKQLSKIGALRMRDVGVNGCQA